MSTSKAVLLALCCAFLSSIALAQFVPKPTNFRESPGAAGTFVHYKPVCESLCRRDPPVRSFAGYSDISPDEHIFWWFFEANDAPEDKPLTIWINGGPA